MSKNSAIIELQKDVLSNKPTVDIVRKAYVIASKLDLPDFLEWLKNELSGYSPEIEKIPEYRKLNGQIRGYNPYHGWQPIIFENTELADKLSICPNSEAIGRIEYTLQNAEPDALFEFPLGHELQRTFYNSTGCGNVKCFISPSEIKGVIEAVRNNILEWSLNLERQGILGENMKFTSEEKHQAHTINIGNIQNFAGSLGNSPGQHTIVNMPSQNASQTIYPELRKILSSIDQYLENFPAVEKQKIIEHKSEIENELAKPDQDAGKVHAALTEIFNITKQLTTNTGAQVLAAMFKVALGLGS